MQSTTNIKVQNFKCFQDINIPLKQLTINVGGNGRGKSTITQVLLLLRSFIEQNGQINQFNNQLAYKLPSEYPSQKLELPLNEHYALKLGHSFSLINQRVETNEHVSFTYSVDNENFLHLDASVSGLNPDLYFTLTEKSKSSGIEHTPLGKQEFYYLNAERQGPRIATSIRYQKFPNVGAFGEYTAQAILLKDGFYKINADRAFENQNNLSIYHQVNYWLNYILPGNQITIISEKNNAYYVQVGLKNEFTDLAVLPTNMGFGVSYVLPIIVSCLLAKKGSLTIIENPEAHLHPGAQSKMGQFIAKMATTGLNIIVETHSDHFVNGIQLSIAKKETNNQDVVINFFDLDPETNNPKVQSIFLNEDAALSNWPKGFFDQTQKDFAELSRLRRQNKQ